MNTTPYIDFDTLFGATLQTALQHELRVTKVQNDNVGQPMTDPAVIRRAFDLADSVWAEAVLRQAANRETQVA